VLSPGEGTSNAERSSAVQEFLDIAAASGMTHAEALLWFDAAWECLKLLLLQHPGLKLVGPLLQLPPVAGAVCGWMLQLTCAARVAAVAGVRLMVAAPAVLRHSWCWFSAAAVPLPSV
jgi:hypothetical protein